MVTLWQQQDGGYMLLWKLYVNNKMAAMRFLHLQQYSHRLNLLYVFFYVLYLVLKFLHVSDALCVHLGGVRCELLRHNSQRTPQRLPSHLGHGILQCIPSFTSITGFIPSQLMKKKQWLLLQFIVLLMMDAKGVRNMQSF